MSEKLDGTIKRLEEASKLVVHRWDAREFIASFIVTGTTEIRLRVGPEGLRSNKIEATLNWPGCGEKDADYAFEFSTSMLFAIGLLNQVKKEMSA